MHLFPHEILLPLALAYMVPVSFESVYLWQFLGAVNVATLFWCGLGLISRVTGEEGWRSILQSLWMGLFSMWAGVGNLLLAFSGQPDYRAIIVSLVWCIMLFSD